MAKKIDKKIQVGKMLLKSSMPEQEKQKLLFALPKMSDEGVNDLYKEVKKTEREERKRISKKLEAQLTKEEKTEEQLKALAKQIPTAPLAVPQAGVGIQITNEMLQQVAQDPVKLTALLIAMGPKEIKRLEQAVKRLGVDPHYQFTQKDLKDTVKKLREFSVDVYQAGQEIDERFRREQLMEQIRLEKEKQAMIKECMDDLDTIAKAVKK